MEEAINTLFDKLVETLSNLLPDFGVNLAIDGKAIGTHARPPRSLKTAEQCFLEKLLKKGNLTARFSCSKLKN